MSKYTQVEFEPQKTRLSSGFRAIELKTVALAGQLSNQFVADLRRLASLAI
jgi:hypothetical protein